MKHVIAFATVGACLVLSGGAALATDPHTTNPSSNSAPGKGQPGSNHGISCGGTTSTGAAIASAPGNGSAANAADSPFSSSPPAYAGNPFNPTAPVAMGGKGVGNPATSVSQYDVACFQAP
jgi:hypothetical protein